MRPLSDFTKERAKEDGLGWIQGKECVRIHHHLLKMLSDRKACFSDLQPKAAGMEEKRQLHVFLIPELSSEYRIITYMLFTVILAPPSGGRCENSGCKQRSWLKDSEMVGLLLKPSELPLDLA